MRQFFSFVKKECMELSRNGKLIILSILFILFGIMNPAMAKLTPWLLETMSDQLADSGMIITEVTVDAMSSWTQFFKNTPVALVVFIIMLGGSFTVEYQRGTLVNMVTKGMKRWKILTAKLLVTEGMWTLCYFGCFGITYGYNAYFWDNSIARHLWFAVVSYWLCGMWLVSVIPLASAFSDSSAPVLLAVGAAYLLPTFLGMFPKIKVYLPTHLMDSMDLLTGAAEPKDYLKALAVAGILFIANIIIGIAGFNRRKL